MATRKRPNTHIVGRDARTGYFIPLRETKRRPSTTIRQRVRNPRKRS